MVFSCVDCGRAFSFSGLFTAGLKALRAVLGAFGVGQP